jgi:hypothetical protein
MEEGKVRLNGMSKEVQASMPKIPLSLGVSRHGFKFSHLPVFLKIYRNRIIIFDKPQI